MFGMRILLYIASEHCNCVICVGVCFVNFDCYELSLHGRVNRKRRYSFCVLLKINSSNGFMMGLMDTAAGPLDPAQDLRDRGVEGETSGWEQTSCLSRGECKSVWRSINTAINQRNLIKAVLMIWAGYTHTVTDPIILIKQASSL